jgi:hypothetical protein
VGDGNPQSHGLSYDFSQSNEGTENGSHSNPERSQYAAPRFSELNNQSKEDVNYLFNSMKIGSSLNRPASTGVIGHGSSAYNDGNSLPSSSSLGLTTNHEGMKSSLDLIQEDISNHPSYDYSSNQASLGLSLSRHSSGNFGSHNSLPDSMHHHDHYSIGRSASAHNHNDFFGRNQMSVGENRIGNQISVRLPLALEQFSVLSFIWSNTNFVVPFLSFSTDRSLVMNPRIRCGLCHIRTLHPRRDFHLIIKS